jgi:hypothetical protein
MRLAKMERWDMYCRSGPGRDRRPKGGEVLFSAADRLLDRGQVRCYKGLGECGA